MYSLDHGHAGGEAASFRLRDSLRRGDHLALMVENHGAYDQRNREIRRGQETLLAYLGVFDEELMQRRLLYGLFSVYLLLTAVGEIFIQRK